MALPILDLSVSAVREVGSEGQFGGEVEGLDNPDVQEADAMRERVRTARVARLATIDPGGRPHLVPIVFVLDGQSLYSAVDAKPKLAQTPPRRERPRAVCRDRPCRPLRRRLGPAWWVSFRGRGRVLDTGVEAERALRLLADKYEQYRRERPGRPVLAVDILEWRSWDASASA